MAPARMQQVLLKLILFIDSSSFKKTSEIIKINKNDNKFILLNFYI